MKRLTLLVLLFFSLSLTSYAKPEEVLLETDLTSTYQVTLSDSKNQPPEKTLREKLSDIYHLEVDYIDKPTFLMSNILTKKFEANSKLERLQLWGSYSGDTCFNFINNEKFSTNYNFSYINVGIDGKLQDNVADFRLMLNISPLSSRNFAQALFADVYVATNKIPNHRILIGNTRPPVGMEGGYSPFLLPFVARSQIARNFGSVRKLGTRIKGLYPLFDYDIGMYSSDTYFKEFFPGTEFVAWMNFKPLGLTDGKYGKLTLGGGVQTGQRSNDYTVSGAYIGYEYKKWLLNFEYANANGYNGPIGHSIDKHATGLYSTLAYRVTPKLQALIRYDELNPDKNFSNSKNKEYSAGINYFIKGQALKLILNYVFCENTNNEHSHRLILGTQILL